MNYLQPQHSARDKLGSESESYNQLSESLCCASFSWPGKRIWSINFSGTLGEFCIIPGILVALHFFICYLLWTYFLFVITYCLFNPSLFLPFPRTLTQFILLFQPACSFRHFLVQFPVEHHPSLSAALGSSVVAAQTINSSLHRIYQNYGLE